MKTQQLNNEHYWSWTDWVAHVKSDIFGTWRQGQIHYNVVNQKKYSACSLWTMNASLTYFLLDPTVPAEVLCLQDNLWLLCCFQIRKYCALPVSIFPIGLTLIKTTLFWLLIQSLLLILLDNMQIVIMRKSRIPKFSS